MVISKSELISAVDSTLDRYTVDKNSTDLNCAVSIEELGTANIETYTLHEPVAFYPASLIKLFDALIARTKIDENPKLVNKSIEDDIRSALKDSSNEALSNIVDFISGTKSGFSLIWPLTYFWRRKREQITDYFHKRSYSQDLRLHNKCFDEGPKGRDKQLLKKLGSNQVRIEDVSKVMKEIMNKFPEIFNMMKREVSNLADYQCQFIAKGLKNLGEQISSFHSKAGWTDSVRHDVAVVKFKDGKEFLLTIMTKGLSRYENLIPDLAENIFQKLKGETTTESPTSSKTTHSA